MTLSLLVAFALTVPSADVTVIESRRSGVTKKASHGVVELVTSELVKGGVNAQASLEAEPVCQGKKPCVLALGRKLKSAIVVTVEVLTVLDDSTVRIEALSIEEDGRRIGVADYSGALSNTQAIAVRVRNLIPLMGEVVTLKKADPVKVEPVKVVTPDVPKKMEPVVLAPDIKVTPELVKVEVAKPVEKTRTLTWVAAGLAVVAGGTGAVTGIMNKNVQGELAGKDLSDAANSNLSSSLGTTATVANVSFVTAGVAAAAAVVLFFVEGN
jgi:hypothetical protein